MSAGAAAIFSTAGNMLTSMINNMWASQMAGEDRAENYRYGEMAANNADKRTRALYADFYSPQALMRQYKEAGLSPSMMFGGTPGQGGTSGAQGSGAAGIQTHFMPMSLVDAAQAATLFAQVQNIKADTKKKEAETENINSDTNLKEVQTNIEQLNKKLKERENNRDWVQFDITTRFIKDKDGGNERSMFEIAKDSKNYHDFLSYVRQCFENMDDKEHLQMISTEIGSRTMRDIYISAKSMDNELTILTSSAVSAKFQASIAKALENVDFQEANANAAIQQLKAAAATNELTERQKNAWNRLINKLGDGVLSDVLIVIAMCLGGFAQSSNIKINTGENHITVNKNTD